MLTKGEELIDSVDELKEKEDKINGRKSKESKEGSKTYGYPEDHKIN